MDIRKWFVAASAAFLLSGCGGGSDAGPDTGPDTGASGSGPEALLANYTKYLNAGETVQFSVSGACVGAAVITNSPATARESFEGALRYYSVTRLVATLQAPPPATPYPLPTAECGLGNIDFTRRNYFTDGYTPFGFAYNNADSLIPTYTGALPAIVRAGDTARLAEFAWYQDSTKSVRRGTMTLDYSASPVSANEIGFNLVSRFYATTGLKQFSETLSYGFDANSGLRLASIRYDYLDGTSLLLTRQ